MKSQGHRVWALRAEQVLTQGSFKGPHTTESQPPLTTSWVATDIPPGWSYLKWFWPQRKKDFIKEANNSCIKTPFPSCLALKHIRLISYSCICFLRLMNSWVVIEATQRAGPRNMFWYPLLHLSALGHISNILLEDCLCVTAFDLPSGSRQYRLELICSFLSRTEAERMPGRCERDPHVGHTLKDTQSFFEKSKPRQGNLG